jgi:predicted transcriptional regulator
MQLTKAEEEVMQILWTLKEGAVRDIRQQFEAPRPARNTVSTIIRILEKKGYVGYTPSGNTHIYYPLVQKEEYSKTQLFRLMKKYFNNSFPAMASFFAREKDLSAKELEELMEEAKRELTQDRHPETSSPTNPKKS